MRSSTSTLAALLVVPALTGCATWPPWEEVESLEVPEWRVGEAWNFTLTWADGRTRGWATYTVVKVEPVPGQSEKAYQVRHTIYRRDIAQSAADPSTTTMWFDAATLNQVWNFTWQRTIGFPQQGRSPEFTFPMRPGDHYSEACCGDVIHGQTHWRVKDPEVRSHPLLNGGQNTTWPLEKRLRWDNGTWSSWTSDWWFAREVGFFVRHVDSWSEPHATVWTLRAHSRPNSF